MKIMQYTINTNINEEWEIIEETLINEIETETDNKDIEGSLISISDIILWFWDKSEWLSFKI